MNRLHPCFNQYPMQGSYNPLHSISAWQCQPLANSTQGTFGYASTLALYSGLQTHTHLTAFFPGYWTTQVGWKQKDKPYWTILKQRWCSGSGISWTICKSFAPRSIQITTPAPHHSSFLWAGCHSCYHPTVSKHWRQLQWLTEYHKIKKTQLVFSWNKSPNFTPKYHMLQYSS